MPIVPSVCALTIFCQGTTGSLPPHEGGARPAGIACLPMVAGLFGSGQVASLLGRGQH
jgi:hypothetical protein